MGKISPVSAKYIIHTEITADGVVDKPDVIGAIFGQTEGLLGTELELRELQKNGRIGRIEVNLDTKSGKTKGTIIIPSSLDMAETAIVASAMETIQRIGPCNARLHVENIEDVRVSKREYVIERAKELLRKTIGQGPESAELMDEIKDAVRALAIAEYGPERLPAGPGIAESEELIIVEGRADVIALLKNGFKNVVGLNGTSVPKSVADLSKQKTTTAFVDGDRGGVLIVKELVTVGELDFVARAPSGKEVEELTQKEINKCLRARVPPDQFFEETKAMNGHTIDFNKKYTAAQAEAKPTIVEPKPVEQRPFTEPRQFEQRPFEPRPQYGERRFDRYEHREQPYRAPVPKLSPEMAKKFSTMLDELTGTRGAYLLDEGLNILGKVPTKELEATIKNLPEVNAVIMDGPVTPDIVRFVEFSKIEYLIGTEANATSRRIKIFTAETLSA